MMTEQNVQSVEKKANKLINETSPYLLQHAYNPVAWYSWCDEAFEKAKNENKPIFLSIGYSTCHWCHVMEHESFEDEEVAKLLNDQFISIKVDREERPNIDNVYMTICQMLTGSGGWPLTIVMTPDKKPFFAGTYFPKFGNYGRMGMLDLIPRLADVWKTRANDVLSSAENIVGHLRELSEVKMSTITDVLDSSLIDSACQQLLRSFDKKNGGFGGAPKFPSPHNLMFLLRCWNKSKQNEILEVVEKTLTAMHMGGIHDHVGYGFHRYSTDSEWLVPHFEKMLYDQSMLSLAYMETFQATGKECYLKIAEEILTYVLRDMTSSEGGFYSAEDADSEGEEGKFYVWDMEELFNILSKEEVKIAFKIFNVKKEGNFSEESSRTKTGTNILHLTESIVSYAKELGMSVNDLGIKLEEIREKLFICREKRIHPLKDDKIITSWNGLMIVALSRASQILKSDKYSIAAEKAVDFILNNMYVKDHLLHSYRKGIAKIDANIDDYTFFIWGLLELYEATFKTKYLKIALDLNNDLDKYFWDKESGGYYFSSEKEEALLIRQKEIYDGAIPSGNSIAMQNLLKLSVITGEQNLKEKAVKISQVFSKNIKQSPMAYTQFLSSSDQLLNPSLEIIIAGDINSPDTNSMLDALRKKYLPNKVLILKNNESRSSSGIKFPNYIEGCKQIENKSTVYVCTNFTCNVPFTDITKVLELLDSR